MARDILKTLKSEHDQLSQLFGQLDATTDRAEKTRTQLLEKIEALLVPHAKWEELAFYPAFADRADSDGLKSHAEAIEELPQHELIIEFGRFHGVRLGSVLVRARSDIASKMRTRSRIGIASSSSAASTRTGCA